MLSLSYHPTPQRQVVLDAAAPRHTGQADWLAMEGPGTRPWAEAVVIINATLQQLTAGRTGVVPLPACVHAVARGDRPRLSISYELRFPPQLERKIQVIAAEFFS